VGVKISEWYYCTIRSWNFPALKSNQVVLQIVVLYVVVTTTWQEKVGAIRITFNNDLKL
jgi:hypothetical protein